MNTMEDISQQLSQLSTSNDSTVSSQKTSSPDPLDPGSIVDVELVNYLLPVRAEYMKKRISNPSVSGSAQSGFGKYVISTRLRENLYHYIWGMDVFYAPRPVLMRIHYDLSAKFSMSPDQSDLIDMLEYHPTEVVSSKLIQLVVAIAVVEPLMFEEDFKYLENLMKKERIMMDGNGTEAYKFILETLNYLFQVLTEGDTNCDLLLKDYKDLTRESKDVIKGLSALYMKVFRAKPRERIERMESVASNYPGSIEWTLYITEMLRLRRREMVAKSKRPTQNELKLVEQTVKMEPNNPFVRMNLIDCVIDALRESHGRFICGDIHLNDTDQAMKFLQDECKKLCEDFPRNVSFLSVVSDYFARYVPYSYFDKELSGKLLKDAYRLNPSNPKTTHRLGIFYRMSMKNQQESLRWLKKTLELDPAYANANIDYYKTILGKPEIYGNVGEDMEAKIKSGLFECWRPLEKIEFRFCIGLAYFAEGKKEKTLQEWIKVMNISEVDFPLGGVDSDCSIFNWNQQAISTDKIREWIQNEVQEMKRQEVGGHCDAEKKKKVERMFHLMLGVVAPKRPDFANNVYAN